MANNIVVNVEKILKLLARLGYNEQWIERVVKGICRYVQKDGAYYLRASRPKLDAAVDPVNGYIMTVWRLVAYEISPNPQHRCMPVVADMGWYLGKYDNRDERKRLMDRLSDIADKITEAFPPFMWRSTAVWGQALFGSGVEGNVLRTLQNVTLDAFGIKSRFGQFTEEQVDEVKRRSDEIRHIMDKVIDSFPDTNALSLATKLELRVAVAEAMS